MKTVWRRYKTWVLCILAVALLAGYSFAFAIGSSMDTIRTVGQLLWFTLRWGYVIAVALFALLCIFIIPLASQLKGHTAPRSDDEDDDSTNPATAAGEAAIAAAIEFNAKINNPMDLSCPWRNEI